MQKAGHIIEERYPHIFTNGNGCFAHGLDLMINIMNEWMMIIPFPKSWKKVVKPTNSKRIHQ